MIPRQGVRGAGPGGLVAGILNHTFVPHQVRMFSYGFATTANRDTGWISARKHEVTVNNHELSPTKIRFAGLHKTHLRGEHFGQILGGKAEEKRLVAPPGPRKIINTAQVTSDSL